MTIAPFTVLDTVPDDMTIAPEMLWSLPASDLIDMPVVLTASVPFIATAFPLSSTLPSAKSASLRADLKDDVRRRGHMDAARTRDDGDAPGRRGRLRVLERLGDLALDGNRGRARSHRLRVVAFGDRDRGLLLDRLGVGAVDRDAAVVPHVPRLVVLDDRFVVVLRVEVGFLVALRVVEGELVRAAAALGRVALDARVDRAPGSPCGGIWCAL
jgi:hypothetical protein